MGFGTLFIGYFLLLNLTYYGFTDIISALVMLLGLYKLSAVNKPFRAAEWICVAFSLFSFGEFVLNGLDFLKISDMSLVLPYIATVRYVAICALTVAVLTGMRDVSREVGLSSLSKKCSGLIIATFAVYFLCILLNAPPLVAAFPVQAVATVALVALLGELILIIINLTAIYSCYMKICMPGEETAPEKPSRFGFVNQYRERQEEKQRQYAEYRLKRAKEKAAKRKDKK